MKRVVLVFTLVLVLPVISWAVSGDMGIGTNPNTDGSQDYPWLIEDLTDFDTFAGNSAYWASGVHTKLMTDIDLAGRTYTTAVIAPDTDSSDPDFQGIKFLGVFDGHNLTICNLFIDETGFDNDYLGLFGWIEGVDTEIKNLGIENINIAEGGSSAYVGGLVGASYYGYVTNCYSTGFVSGDSFVGGLVGYNGYRNLTNCYSTCAVSGTGGYIGGLVGWNSRGSIINCSSIGPVSGIFYNSVGGLVGWNYHGSITICHSTSIVSGNSSVGGLIGQIDSGSVTNCYSTGHINGGSRVGGLVG